LIATSESGLVIAPQHHTPGDSKHGEKRAQLVRPEIAKDLREDV
jgi:hypothetical protein